MTLPEKIIALYPELSVEDLMNPFGPIRLQNDSDGRGDYIASWTHPIYAKPTEEQLA
jgi:hypothetical protein